MAATESLEGNKPLLIRRGIVESVDLYEIKDSELDALEKGTSAELQLNFSIFLFSVAFSAITALFTATFWNESVKTTFIVVSVVGILLGSYLMIAWWRAKGAVKTLCKTIRMRIAAIETLGAVEGTQEAEDIDGGGVVAPNATAGSAGPVAGDETPKG